jgi:hypothetical protein
MSRGETKPYRSPPPRSGQLPGVLTRRRVFTGVTAAVVSSCSRAEAHAVGRVIPPVAISQINVITDTGERRSLCDLLAGHTTAVQLMFTRCRSSVLSRRPRFRESRTRLVRIPGVTFGYCH